MEQQVLDDHTHGSELGVLDFEKMANPFPTDDPSAKKSFLPKTYPDINGNNNNNNNSNGNDRYENSQRPPKNMLRDMATGAGLGGQDAIKYLVLHHGSSEFDLAMEATRKKVDIDDLVRGKMDNLVRRWQFENSLNTSFNDPTSDPTIRFRGDPSAVAPSPIPEDPETKALQLKIHISNEIKERFHHVVASLSTKEQAKLANSHKIPESSVRQKLLKDKLGDEIKNRFQQVVQQYSNPSTKGASKSEPPNLQTHSSARDNPNLRPFVSLSDLSKDVIKSLPKSTQKNSDPSKKNPKKSNDSLNKTSSTKNLTKETFASPSKSTEIIQKSKSKSISNSNLVSSARKSKSSLEKLRSNQ